MSLERQTHLSSVEQDGCDGTSEPSNQLCKVSEITEREERSDWAAFIMTHQFSGFSGAFTATLDVLLNSTEVLLT